MSKLLSLDSIEPGAVLAEPVTNSLGQTLINSGVALTAKHISILRTWNVNSVKIVVDSDDEITDISEEHLVYAKSQMQKMISWTPRNDAEQDIIDLGILAIAHKYKNSIKRNE